MTDELAHRDGEWSAQRLRQALHRHALASQRFRELVGRHLGISTHEVMALGHLALTAPTTPTNLGRALGLSSGGISALVQRMHRRGHITRTPHPNDHRSCLLQPTDTGSEQVGALFRPLIDALDRLAAELTPQQRALVGTVLDRAARLAAEAADELYEPWAVSITVSDPRPTLWA